MRIGLSILFGLAMGMLIGGGVSLLQAEPQLIDGESRLVVQWVWKNQIIATPVLERGLVVGLGLGMLGAITGHRVASGGTLLAAVIGAVVLFLLAEYVDTLMPNLHGRAGQQTCDLTLVFASMLGAALGAEASLRVQERRRNSRQE